MKKLRTLSNLWVTEARKITGILIIALGLGFGFWSVTADPSSGGHDSSGSHDNDRSHDSGSSHDGDRGHDADKGHGDNDDHGNGTDKCIVCHNDHNFHEISIPCDQVAKYLQNHPGDHAGPCTVTSVTNP